MRMTERYVVTGDRYADQVLTYLIEFLEKKYNISIDEFDPFYEECNLEKFIEFVFNEFPMTVDTPNAEYDVEWAWEEFINSKDGRNAEDWINKQTEKYEVAIINEYLDNDLIAESLDKDDIDNIMLYLTQNAEAKSLNKKDKVEIVTAFNEGVTTKLSNGFSFNPSEYCDVVCAINDEDESTEEDLKRVMKSEQKEFQRGNILVRTIISNPHLYDWADIDFVFEIRIGALVYDAVRA